MTAISFRRAVIILLISLVAACTAIATRQLNELYGAPEVRDRIVSAEVAAESDVPEFYRDVKPIIDNRCVVCHACYDSPCQLNLSAFEGIERGASKEVVYTTRMREAQLTRLFIDADTSQEWRARGFYPVLNEREQSTAANLAGGTMYRMLEQKRQHPLPAGAILPDTFDFTLDGKQQCTKVINYDDYAQKFPLWGMPYALPGLSGEEFSTLKQWIAGGARATERPPLEAYYQQQVNNWEAYLNGSSNKHRLVSRYIYEHLFLADIYFQEGDNNEFFKLVRSVTPSGQPIEVIATRRPFDSPGDEPFFYRLSRVKTTIVAKTHMPYLLDDKRRQRWNELFFETDYEVEKLPAYSPETASNPFITFQKIPDISRYKFMLDEAEFTIMGFIKGPVCRGQTALNVINDQFWMVFVNPESRELQESSGFLSKQKDLLQMPLENNSNIVALSTWYKYASYENEYQVAKREFMKGIFPNGKNITLDLIWDGDGDNRNAALTIFRHFDSASVQKGLIGDVPKTALVVGYTLLERIHYLLVANYDVYGNVSHQLMTRMYMDFLRMDGQSNFVSFMPEPYGEQLMSSWYQGAESHVTDYLEGVRLVSDKQLGIDYKTDDPMKEFFTLLEAKLGPAVVAPDLIDRAAMFSSPLLDKMHRLSRVKGDALSQLSELSLLRVKNKNGGYQLFSLVKNRVHSNVSYLFNETDRLIFSEQTLTVEEGIVGAYNYAYFDIDYRQLDDFIDAVSKLGSARSYSDLQTNYGVRRTNINFWTLNDWINDYYLQRNPVEGGLLDLNRLENR